MPLTTGAVRLRLMGIFRNEGEVDIAGLVTVTHSGEPGYPAHGERQPSGQTTAGPGSSSAEQDRLT